MDHNGAYHKGYIDYTPEGGFKFIVRRNARSRKVDWSIPLPDFKQNWTTLVGEDILIPGHSTVSSFLKSTTKHSTPSLNFVSAKNLLSPCPPSLVKPSTPRILIGMYGLTPTMKKRMDWPIWMSTSVSRRSSILLSSVRGRSQKPFHPCVY